MTKYEIRAELAGKAMAALVSNSALFDYLNSRYTGDNEFIRKTIAQEAVGMADAVLAEIEKTTQEHEW